MTKQKQVRVQINCQKGKTLETEYLMNSGSYAKDNICIELSEHLVGECHLGRFRLKIESDVLEERSNLASGMLKMTLAKDSIS